MLASVWVRSAGRSPDPPFQNRAREQMEKGREMIPPLCYCESLSSTGELGPALLLKMGGKCVIVYVVFSACEPEARKRPSTGGSSAALLALSV
jgi:hypothetical protein